MKAETSFGTFTKPTDAAPGSIQVEGLTIDHSGGERIDRVSASPRSRGIVSRVTGKKSTSWSLERHLRPSGTAGTPPEDHALWVAALGGYTNTPATSDVYAPTSTQGAMGSLTLVDHVLDAWRAAYGAFVDEVKISQTGPTPPLVTFSGRAKDIARAGYGVVAGGGISGAAITLNSAKDAKAFSAGGVVAFYDPTTGAMQDDNSGDGWRIVSVAGAVLTLEGSPSTAAAADLVRPFTPEPDYLGDALGGILGSVKITPDGESQITLDEVEKIEVTILNENVAHDQVAFSATPVNYTEGMLRPTASLTVLLRRDQWHFLGRHATDPSSLFAVEITWGTTAGEIVVVELPQAELVGLPAEFPPTGLCKITLNFFGLASAFDANDQISVAFQ